LPVLWDKTENTYIEAKTIASKALLANRIAPSGWGDRAARFSFSRPVSIRE